MQMFLTWLQSWTRSEDCLLLCLIVFERSFGTTVKLGRELLEQLRRHPICQQNQRTLHAVRIRIGALRNQVNRDPSLLAAPDVQQSISQHVPVIQSWIGQYCCQVTPDSTTQPGYIQPTQVWRGISTHSCTLCQETLVKIMV